MLNYISNVARELSDALNASGGFTYSPAQPTPTTGYSVVCKDNAQHSIAVQGKARAEEIEFYLEKYNVRLNREEPTFVGAWYDSAKDLTWLELATHIDNKTTAILEGANNGKDAIWDFEKCECISVR